VVQRGSLVPAPDLPLYTFIGRVTEQKGVDVLIRALELLPAAARLQVLVLGSGDPTIEKELVRVSRGRNKRFRLCYLRGYDPLLANRIYAAGDFFLIPSLYEPCGLTDYIAQLLGNLPIVHLVGGLVKVVDGETGFGYRPHTPAALAETMERADVLYRGEPDKIHAMQQAAVRRIHAHHTWKRVMGRYLDLYEKARRKTC
jgi:starch synthase